CHSVISGWTLPMAWKVAAFACTCLWEVSCDGAGRTVPNARPTASPAWPPLVALGEDLLAGSGFAGRAAGWLDRAGPVQRGGRPVGAGPGAALVAGADPGTGGGNPGRGDRKSTRLNSSHVKI